MPPKTFSAPFPPPTPLGRPTHPGKLAYGEGPVPAHIPPSHTSSIGLAHPPRRISPPPNWTSRGHAEILSGGCGVPIRTGGTHTSEFAHSDHPCDSRPGLATHVTGVTHLPGVAHSQTLLRIGAPRAHARGLPVSSNLCRWSPPCHRSHPSAAAGGLVASRAPHLFVASSLRVTARSRDYHPMNIGYPLAMLATIQGRLWSENTKL
jgi:hypothetical protein